MRDGLSPQFNSPLPQGRFIFPQNRAGGAEGVPGTGGHRRQRQGRRTLNCQLLIVNYEGLIMNG